LAPLVAVFDVAVPQLSGRGLGHTGGTLDKLESIAGWQASMSNEQMLAQLDDVGAVICAAGSGLAPPTRSSTRCAMSPARWRRSRSSPPRS
jgi:thymidine phosphorylase